MVPRDLGGGGNREIGDGPPTVPEVPADPEAPRASPPSSRVMIAVRAHRAQPSSRLIGGISSDIERRLRRRFISSIIGVDDGYLYWDYYVVIEREKKEPAGRDKR